MTRPVPHGWKEVALSDVSNAHSGGTPSRDEPDFWNDGIPWMKIEDITKSGKYLSTTIETISDLGLQKSAAKLFPVGTVFLAMYASVGELCISKIETSCNQAILGFSNLKNIQRDYLYYYLLSLKEAWKRDIQTGSQPNLNKGLVLGRTILLPPLPEQEGIAAVLGSVDATIDATKQVIAQTRQLKRAVMQTLLTRGLPGQHTQFKPSPLGTIPADWEVVKLGSCVEFGPQNGLYKHASHYGSGTYIVRIDDFQNGRFIRSSNFKRTDLTQQEITSFKLDKGDFLINRVNSLSHLGKAAIVPDLDEDTVFESNMMRLKFKQSVLNVVYANYWFLGEFALQQIKNFAKIAVAQCSISQQDVSSFLIPLPPLPEQEAIVGILNTVDARLARETETLTRLQTLKTALMQVLLTGEVRVPAALGMSRPAEYGETSPIAVREIVRQGSR